MSTWIIKIAVLVPVSTEEIAMDSLTWILIEQHTRPRLNSAILFKRKIAYKIQLKMKTVIQDNAQPDNCTVIIWMTSNFMYFMFCHYVF